MEEHKIKYREEQSRNSGCIHQLSKYARTILQRGISPKLGLRSKSEVNSEGKKIRRRNVYTKFNEKTNVKANGNIADEQSNTEENIVTPTSNSAKDSFDRNISVDAYKEKVRRYALKWKIDGNDNWFNNNDIDDVSYVFNN